MYFILLDRGLQESWTVESATFDELLLEAEARNAFLSSSMLGERWQRSGLRQVLAGGRQGPARSPQQPAQNSEAMKHAWPIAADELYSSVNTAAEHALTAFRSRSLPSQHASARKILGRRILIGSSIHEPSACQVRADRQKLAKTRKLPHALMSDFRPRRSDSNLHIPIS